MDGTDNDASRKLSILASYLTTAQVAEPAIR